MEQLLYKSRVAGSMESGNLFRIIETSARNNLEADITGFLFYTGTSFLQLVEGPPAALDDLMVRLRRDPRHADIAVLARERIAARSFPAWRMQRCDLTRDGTALVLSRLGEGAISRAMRAETTRFLGDLAA
jgi:hypothetical protein